MIGILYNGRVNHLISIRSSMHSTRLRQNLRQKDLEIYNNRRQQQLLGRASRRGEEAEVVSLSVLFDVLHPQGPLFPIWHKRSLVSDVRIC